MRWWWLVILFGAGAYLVAGGLPGETRPHAVRPATSRERAGEGAHIFAGGIVEGAHPVLPVRFEVSGRVKRVFVREGEQVKEKQILAELDPEAWELRVLQALAQLKIAQAERDRLLSAAGQNTTVGTAGNRTVERPVSESVVPAGRDGRASLPSIASQQDFERQRQSSARVAPQGSATPSRTVTNATSPTPEELAIADARVALADAAVKHEQCMLDKTRLLAPMEGTILSSLPETGQLVGPADEREPFSIVSRDQIRVRAFVEELDAMDVGPGRKASVIAAGRPDRKYTGTVVSCSPYMQPKSHMHLKPGERIDVRVREVLIRLDDGGDLLIGLPVDVLIAPPSSPPTKMARGGTGGTP